MLSAKPITWVSDRDLIDAMRALARLHGWALGVHGSLRRDIDLIAVPWIEEASHVEPLVDAFCTRLNLVQEGELSCKRAHGRWTTLLRHPDARIAQVVYGENRPWGMGIFHPKTHWDPPIIDLSLIDPRRLGDLTVIGVKAAEPTCPIEGFHDRPR